MPIQNADIAAAFIEVADLLEIEGANPFRIRAYRNAARVVSDTHEDVPAMVEKGGDLTALPGIGDDLADKIRQIVATGKAPFLEDLRREMPPAVAELLRVPTLGPRRVRSLWQDLGIETRVQLERAVNDGRIRDLPGFGEKSEARIRQALSAGSNKSRRFPLAFVTPYAERLVGQLSGLADVEQVEVAGSFRRRKESVGDLDILVIAAPGDTADAAISAFTHHGDVEEVLASGPTRASVRLKGGLQADLRVVARESYGAALQYFTGSKAHNVALRRLARDQGLKINEYGVFRGNARIGGDTEESVYQAVGLPWIPPDQREGQGEIEAARDGVAAAGGPR